MANGAKLAYVRVSTEEQNEARQVEALKQYDIDKWFIEKVSGKDMNRPKLREMLDYAREGDTIYIHDFSRISRSVADLMTLTKDLQERGIHLKSNKEGFDTMTPMGLSGKTCWNVSVRESRSPSARASTRDGKRRRLTMLPVHIMTG